MSEGGEVALNPCVSDALRGAAALLPLHPQGRGLVLRLLRRRVGMRPGEAATLLDWPVRRLARLERGVVQRLPLEERVALLVLYAAGPLDVALGAAFASHQEPEARLRQVFEGLWWEADGVPVVAEPPRQPAALRAALESALERTAEEDLVTVWVLLELLRRDRTAEGRDRLAAAVDEALTRALREVGQTCDA